MKCIMCNEEAVQEYYHGLSEPISIVYYLCKEHNKED